MEYVDVNGHTPLHIASYFGDFKIERLFTTKGANPLYETAAAQNDAEDEEYGGAAWDHDSVKYVRITNLAGNSNFIYIIVKNSANDEAVFKIYGTESLLLYRHTGTFEAIAGAATATNVADIAKVSIQADTSTQAVELFLASSDAA